MLITYRRTGGLLALVAFAALALGAAMLTVAVAATTLIVVVAMAVAVRLAQAVLPASWWRPTAPPASPWPQETIEARAVKPPGSSDERDLRRLKGGRWRS